MQVFNALGDDSVHAIAQRFLRDVAMRTAALGLELHVSRAAFAHLCAEGFEASTGARQMRRTITALVEDPLADFVLARPSVSDTSVVVDCVDGKVVLREGAPAEISAQAAGQGKCLSFPVERVPVPPPVQGAPLTLDV